MIEWLVLQTIYVLYKEIIQFLDLKFAIYNQERIISACVWCIVGRKMVTLRCQIKSRVEKVRVGKHTDRQRDRKK